MTFVAFCSFSVLNNKTPFSVFLQNENCCQLSDSACSMENGKENGSVDPIENVSIFILNIALTFVVFYCTAAL